MDKRCGKNLSCPLCRAYFCDLFLHLRPWDRESSLSDVSQISSNGHGIDSRVLSDKGRYSTRVGSGTIGGSW